jgi:hypothetical protein
MPQQGQEECGRPLWGYKTPVPQDGTWATLSEVVRLVRLRHTSRDYRLY